MKPLAHLEIQYIRTDELLEYPNNAKLHPSDQIDQLAASIEEFNFNNPILAWHNDDGEPEIVAGHGRLMAARKLGLEELPVVFLDHMSEEQRRAYIIVDNSTNLSSGFDMEILNVELEGITDIDMSVWDLSIELDDFGFDESGLDDDTEKENVIISINCKSVDDYETIKEQLQQLLDSINASLSVKMA